MTGIGRVEAFTSRPLSSLRKERSLILNWLQPGGEIAAPMLFIYETTRYYTIASRKEITQSEADQALSILDSQNITHLHSPAIRQSAWELARRLNRPNGLGQFYLALAQEQTCPFRTADKHRYNAVKMQLDHVLGQ